MWAHEYTQIKYFLPIAKRLDRPKDLSVKRKSAAIAVRAMHAVATPQGPGSRQLHREGWGRLDCSTGAAEQLKEASRHLSNPTELVQKPTLHRKDSTSYTCPQHHELKLVCICATGSCQLLQPEGHYCNMPPT